MLRGVVAWDSKLTMTANKCGLQITEYRRTSGNTMLLVRQP